MKKQMQSVLLRFLLIGGIVPQTISSNIITIENASGEKIELGIDANDRFLDVLSQLQNYFQEDQFVNNSQDIETSSPREASFLNSQWNLVVSHAGIILRAQKDQWRNYQASVSKTEKGAIAYIVNTLAYDNLLTINDQKSSLKKKGDQIKHIHPFCFLRTVFLDEQMKVGIAAIRDRISWIRDGFFDGIYGSLDEEADRKNLLPFVSDFAQSLNIKEELIKPSLEKRKWKDFINTLIDNIPRENDPNRYNM